MRQLLAFTVEQDALDFQAAASAAVGYPLKDGITVRYDDLAFDYASGTWLHRYDDVLAAAGLDVPATATIVADETTIQRAPTPLQAALVEMGQTPAEAVATVAQDATLTAITATAVDAQPLADQLAAP